MPVKSFTTAVAVSVMLTLAACSSSDDDDNESSQLNPDLDNDITPGEPGGDTTSLAGLWDGTAPTGPDEIEDVVYWHIAANGVLTRYDYQQDGVVGSSSENCYVIGDPMTLTPEGGDSYSIANVAATLVREDDNLSVTLVEEDSNDIDEDGDLTEMPTLELTLLTTPVLADLNSCSNEEASVSTDETESESEASASGEDDPLLSDDQLGGGLPTGVQRPQMTADECGVQGGTIVGDIGDGAIHSAEYRCESGQPPIASILYSEGESIPTEGAVCCV